MLEIVILVSVIIGSLSVFCYFARRTDKQFQSMLEREIETLDQRTKSAQQMERVDIDSLPPLVRSYASDMLDPDKQFNDHVHISHLGEFRLGDESGWFPMESDSHALLSEFAFIWSAFLNPETRFTVSARDKLIEGEGSMLLKPAYSRNMENRSGPEITTSMIVRYLSEIPWYPASIIYNHELEWTQESGNSVRVSAKAGSIRASGVFVFDTDGRITEFATTERYRETDEGFEQIPWTLRYSDYKEMDGVQVPTEIEAAWTLEGKNFPYLRLEAVSADYAAKQPSSDV